MNSVLPEDKDKNLDEAIVKADDAIEKAKDALEEEKHDYFENTLDNIIARFFWGGPATHRFHN